MAWVCCVSAWEEENWIGRVYMCVLPGCLFGN